MRPTRATVEGLRICPFLDNDATIGCLVRELPKYIDGAATQDVVIQCEGKKVEWWRRGFLIGLPVVDYVLVPDFLSLGRGVTKLKLKDSLKIMISSKLGHFCAFLFKQRIS